MGTLLLNKSYFNKGRTIFVLAFIIMLASALRLPWYTVGLYGDETINYAYFGFLPLKNIFLNYIDPNQHTFYIFVTRIFRELFGESEIIFRLPALLAGLSAPPILFILAKRLLKSEMTACVAAFLLTVSISHIHYSQRGRGYTFTVLFALLMVYAVLNLLEKRKPILWGFIFALIGFAAVLTLPSNAAFLVAVTFFFTIALCRSEFSFSAFFRFSNMIRFWPFLVCGLIGSGYFWIIFQDLEKGLQIYRNYAQSVGFDIHWSIGLFSIYFSELLSPLSFWFCPLFLWGLFSIRSTPYFLSLIGLIITPFLIQIIIGVLPPARAWIYLLPFLCMIAGAGLTTCYQQIKTKTPHLVGVTGIFLILGYALMTVKPKYEAYYQERAKKISTKIEDAVQLKAQWKYFILPHSLVILPSVDRILTHYVSGDVTKANVTTLLEGKVNEIILIGPKPFKAKNFLIPQSEEIKNKTPITAFEPVREIGDLIVTRFSGHINRVFPKSMEPDFERRLVKPLNDGSFKINFNNSESEYVEGNQSISVFNKTSKNRGLIFFDLNTNKFKIPNTVKEKFLITLNIKKFNQDGWIFLYDKTNFKDLNYYHLNYLQSAFQFNNATIKPMERLPFEWHHRHVYDVPVNRPDPYWLIGQKLYPLSKRSYDLIVGIFSTPGLNKFDGFQAYLLTT